MTAPRPTTINYLVERFKEYYAAALDNGLLYSFGAGDVTELVHESDNSHQRSELHYPVLFAEPGDSWVDLTAEVPYNKLKFNLYFLDALLSDNSNYVNCLSDMFTLVQEFNTWVRKDCIDKDYRIDTFESGTKIFDHTIDKLAGYMVTVVFTASQHPGACYLSLDPPPGNFSLNDNTMDTGTTQTLTLTATGLKPTTVISISNGTLNSYTILSSTQATLNVTASVTAGTANLTIGGVEFTNAITYEQPAVNIYPGDTHAWVRTSNVTTGNRTLKASGSTSWGNGGAGVNAAIPAGKNGKIEFKIRFSNAGSHSVMLGLDASDPDWSYNTIDYAIYFIDGEVHVYENGNLRYSGSTWVENDTFTVQRTAGTVQYKKNGTVFYTSAVSSTGQLTLDSAFNGADRIEFYDIYMQYVP